MAKTEALSEIENDGDSPMLDHQAMTKDSSLDSPATPPGNILPPSSELSPPDSQGPIPIQMSSSESSIPFNPLSGSGSKVPPSAALNSNGSGSGSGNASGNGASGLKTEQDTGYQWRKDEDAPGHAWLNPKAQEESHRAWNTLVDRERMIKGRYGDVLLG